VTRRIGGWRWVAALLGAVAVAVLAFGLPFAAPLLVVAVFVVNIASQGIKIVVDTASQVVPVRFSALTRWVVGLGWQVRTRPVQVEWRSLTVLATAATAGIGSVSTASGSTGDFWMVRWSRGLDEVIGAASSASCGQPATAEAVASPPGWVGRERSSRT
jgi:hypothetical protein